MNPQEETGWEKRWAIFKKEELSVHSKLWLRNKAETIALFEEFLRQELSSQLTQVEEEVGKEKLDTNVPDPNARKEWEWGKGYNQALTDVLEMLKKREEE